MKKTLYAILVIALVVGIAFIIKNQAKPVDQNEIVIGAPLALTGIGATDGLSMKRGIDLAQDDLAKQGIRVRVVYQDDATDPKQTVSAIRQIIQSEDHVDALIGPTWSFLAEASASTINSNKVVSYSPGNTSEFVKSKSPYLFFGAVRNGYRASSTTEWLKTMNVHKIAIGVDKTTWGESVLKPFVEAAKSAGVEIALIEEIPFGSEKDQTPIMLARARNLKVDAILWTGYDEGTTVLVKRMQETGMNIPVLDASTILQGLIKNKVVALRPTDKIYHLTTKISDDFSQKFYKKYGTYPLTYADSAYDGVMLLVKAIKEKPAGITLAEYLKSPSFSYHGYQTDYSFDQNGDIKGGEWVVKKLE